MAGQAGVAGWSTSGWILFCGFRRKVTGIDLKIRRADSVIAVSFIVMMLMGGLALSLPAMVLRVMASGRKADLVPLSFSLSLIFGLPALRNMQPGVPVVGAFGDYVSFIWAEIIGGSVGHRYHLDVAGSRTR